MYRDAIRMHRVRAESGESETTLEVDDRVINARGVLHGGALCDLLDAAIASAVRSAVPEGFGAVTASLTVEFIRPVPKGSQVRALGHTIYVGRNLAYGRAEALIGDRIVGSANGTWKVVTKERHRYREGGSGE